MSSEIPMMTALHLSAALAALGPIMARASLAGDGLGVLLLEGVSQQIRESMGRLPVVEESPTTPCCPAKSAEVTSAG